MSNLAPTGDDRILAAIRAIIRAEFPQFTYAGVWEYAVQAVYGTGASSTADLQPTDAAIPLGPLARIPQLPGLIGEGVTLAVGSIVRVQFLNCDPTRAYIVGTNEAPLDASLGGGSVGSAPGVVRVGDGVSVNVTAAQIAALGLISNGFAVLPAASPVPGTLTGSTTSGSIRVSSG